MHAQAHALSLFFFNDTATTEIYTLSLHDALPILRPRRSRSSTATWPRGACTTVRGTAATGGVHRRPRRWRTGSSPRSEEHTSELQSRQYLVCRLLLEKKK